MSILIAVKNNGKIYMGGDREVSRDGMAATSTARVWESPQSKGVMIGCISPSNIITNLKTEILFDAGNWFAGYKLFDYSAIKQMVNRIRTQFRYCIGDEESYAEYENGAWEMNAQFLMSRNDILFAVDQHGTPVEIDDFCSIGSGSSYAFNSLASTTGADDPVECIKKALYECIRNGVKIDFPFSVWCTNQNCADELVTLYEKDFM